jgi:hypothetical protein
MLSKLWAYPNDFNCYVATATDQSSPQKVHWLIGRGLSSRLHVSVRRGKNHFITSTKNRQQPNKHQTSKEKHEHATKTNIFDKKIHGDGRSFSLAEMYANLPLSMGAANGLNLS